MLLQVATIHFNALGSLNAAGIRKKTNKRKLDEK